MKNKATFTSHHVAKRFIRSIVFSTLLCAQLALAQAPATRVEYIQLEPTHVREWRDYSAQISAVERVDIRPLVGGRIVQVLFEEGQQVAQGEALFVIDPRPFEAAVKKAEAELATAQANARLSAQELKRSAELKESKLISQSLYDQAHTRDDVTQASLLEAQSGLAEARLNLEYAHIVAPIAGRVGRAELTLGNVVDSGPAAPVLTTVVAQDRVYAEFRVDERTYLSLTQAGVGGHMPVQMQFEGLQQPLEGRVHAFDNHLDAASGTIRTRAVFDNPNQRLVPGMFVNVRLGSPAVNSALLIPERAIGTNQDRKFVYVIDDANIAQYREITLGAQHGGQRAVRAGLDAGERVVVNGQARLRPNAPVEAVEQPPAAEALAQAEF